MTTGNDGAVSGGVVDDEKHYPSSKLPSQEHILKRQSYVSSVNYATKIPNWVSEVHHRYYMVAIVGSRSNNVQECDQ